MKYILHHDKFTYTVSEKPPIVRINDIGFYRFKDEKARNEIIVLPIIGTVVREVEE